MSEQLKNVYDQDFGNAHVKTLEYRSSLVADYQAILEKSREYRLISLDEEFSGLLAEYQLYCENIQNNLKNCSNFEALEVFFKIIEDMVLPLDEIFNKLKCAIDLRNIIVADLTILNYPKKEITENTVFKTRTYVINSMAESISEGLVQLKVISQNTDSLTGDSE